MTNIQTTITTTLIHEDIQNLLTGFAGSIELDQIRVDALPSKSFHPMYDDGLWRGYRHDHLNFISQLLPTVDAIPYSLLQELTWLAITCETRFARKEIVDLFAEGATGLCPAEEFESAAPFFGSLIKNLSRQTPVIPLNGDARGLMMKWLTLTDPLSIAEDPECGYGRPRGFVS
jgi:hypothetical protein